MNKHTPAPWGYEYSKANRAYEIAPFDENKYLDWSREICITASKNMANARLIAASPELLWVLESIVEMNPALPMGLIEAAEAAIAKATGRKA